MFAGPADWAAPVLWDHTVDSRKVVFFDTDHTYAWGATQAMVSLPWKSLTRGMNMIFMDDMNASAYNRDPVIVEAIRRRLGQTLKYAQKVNLTSMRPNSALSSTAYCLASPGAEYLVYQPGSGAFSVNLLAKSYSIEWFNPATGAASSGGSITASAGSRSFTPPFSGEAVLYLESSDAATVPPPPPAPSTGNQIRNPSFESGTAEWNLHTDGSAAFTAVTSPVYAGAYAARYAVTTPGTNVQLYQVGISLEPNTDYSLSFAAFSNTGHDMQAILHQHGTPFTNYGLAQVVDLGTAWRRYTLNFRTTGFTSPVSDARLRLWLADTDAAGDSFHFDDFLLVKGTMLTGDVNADGAVNVSDVQAAVNQALGAAACARGDLNGDGTCTVSDVQLVVNKAIGL